MSSALLAMELVKVDLEIGTLLVLTLGTAGLIYFFGCMTTAPRPAAV